MAKKSIVYREQRREYPVQVRIAAGAAVARVVISDDLACAAFASELALEGKIPGVTKSSW